MRVVAASGVAAVIFTGLMLGLLPAAAVGTGPGHQDAVGAEETDEGVTGEGLTWFAPEQVRVGRPVHAAVAVLTGEGLATSMHQDLSIWVTLDDELLLHTASVHEHQGLHLVTVTPQAPGTLKFWADDGSGDHGDHLLRTPEATASPPEPKGMAVEVEVTGQPLEAAALVRMDPALQVDRGWSLVTENKSVPFSAQIKVSDEEGRLVLGGWPVARSEGSFWIGPLREPLYGQALLAPHPGAEIAPFAETTQSDRGPADLPPLPGGVGVPVEELQLPSCSQAPGRLVVDPNSVLMTEDQRGFQEWSDIRLHYLDPDRMEDPGPQAVRYMLSQWPVSADTVPLQMALTTEHPFAYAALRPPTGPGTYVLSVGQEGPDEGFSWLCSEHIRLLPEPVALEGAGVLEVEMEVDEDRFMADLRSMRAGQPLPHYEFDVQILRLADEQPAALVWNGKLHGHAGEVSFMMSSLVPGDYEMRVHPSPQDPGVAPVATGPDGFVYPFVVEDGRGDVQEDGVEQQDAPLPGVALWVALGALVALVVLRRRA